MSPLLFLFSLLAPAKIRNQLPEWLDDKPGGLGQITIWAPLVEYLERIDYRSAQHFSKQKFVCKWLTNCQFIISENIAEENNGTEIKFIQRDKMSQTTCFSEPKIGHFHPNSKVSSYIDTLGSHFVDLSWNHKLHSFWFKIWLKNSGGLNT